MSVFIQYRRDKEVNLKRNLIRTESRRQKYIRWWSQVRAKGGLNFAWKVMVGLSLLFFVPVSAIEFFVDGVLDGRSLLVRAIGSVVVSIIISAVGWWGNEAKYKNIMIDERIRLTQDE
jgi:hypothetical protein